MRHSGSRFSRPRPGGPAAAADRTRRRRRLCGCSPVLAYFAIAALVMVSGFAVFAYRLGLASASGRAATAQSLEHLGHSAASRVSVWGEYLRSSAMAVLPSCSMRVYPTLFRNDTHTVTVLWETNKCAGIPRVRWRRMRPPPIPDGIHLRGASASAVVHGGGSDRVFGVGAEHGDVRVCHGVTSIVDDATYVHKCELGPLANGEEYEYQALIMARHRAPQVAGSQGDGSTAAVVAAPTLAEEKEADKDALSLAPLGAADGETQGSGAGGGAGTKAGADYADFGGDVAAGVVARHHDHSQPHALATAWPRRFVHVGVAAPAAGAAAAARSTPRAPHTVVPIAAATQHDAPYGVPEGASHLWHGDPATAAASSSPSAAATQIGDMQWDFTAAVVADAQSGADTFRHHVAHLSEHHPNLLVHIGDSVQDYKVGSEWHAYLFGPLEQGDVGGTVPLVFAKGNHDGPTSDPHSVYYPHPPYALTAGAVRIVVVDSEDGSDAQLQWLQAELASPQTQSCPWIVVLAHIPPFVEFWEPEAWERGESEWGAFMRTKYVDVFERHGVDMVISGHSHLYQRGRRHGIEYVVAGGGGASPLEDTRVAEYDLYSVSWPVHHYGLLQTYKRCTLQWRTFDLLDDEFDAVRLERPGCA